MRSFRVFERNRTYFRRNTGPKYSRSRDPRGRQDRPCPDPRCEKAGTAVQAYARAAPGQFHGRMTEIRRDSIIQLLIASQRCEALMNRVVRNVPATGGDGSKGRFISCKQRRRIFAVPDNESGFRFTKTYKISGVRSLITLVTNTIRLHLSHTRL
jgi:hypothetical protein